jgi:hypothetical protein
VDTGPGPGGVGSALQPFLSYSPSLCLLRDVIGFPASSLLPPIQAASFTLRSASNPAVLLSVHNVVSNPSYSGSAGVYI